MAYLSGDGLPRFPGKEGVVNGCKLLVKRNIFMYYYNTQTLRI